MNASTLEELELLEFMKCLVCQEKEPWSRGLCSGCYSSASRTGTLNEYPTRAFTDDPESHIRWAMGLHPDLVADIAVEFGYRVIKT